MPKKRILVIDDEDLIRTAMTAILEGNGYDVEEAESGETGLECVAATIPDLIICDVNMGGIDGYHVLQELQKKPETGTIPFLFLTGYSDRDHFRHGMTLGADDYLLKPITQSELLLAVERRLNKHSAIREQTERRMDALRANISLALPHELRTPLHGILGFCGLLQNDYASLSAEDVKDLAGRIKRAADRLQRLIENFLIFAQLEVVASDDRQIGELRAAESPDVVRLVEIVGRQRAAHYRRPGDFAVIGTASNASIEESSLTRLVDELLDNAFKFSNSGSPVTVTVEPAGTFCQLTINDHGRGMAPEQVDALGAYMQFNRRVQEQQGSGLGFVIARRLIELHGGTVQVESKEQEGTTVRISLPRPSPPTT